MEGVFPWGTAGRASCPGGAGSSSGSVRTSELLPQPGWYLLNTGKDRCKICLNITFHRKNKHLKQFLFCMICSIHIRHNGFHCTTKHSHQIQQECHAEEKNATKAAGTPVIHLPASLLPFLISSPGRHLQLDDNEFDLSTCRFMSLWLVKFSWITSFGLNMVWMNISLRFLYSSLTRAPSLSLTPVLCFVLL